MPRSNNRSNDASVAARSIDAPLPPIAEVAAALALAREVDEIMRRVVDGALELTRASGAYVEQIASNREEVEIVAAAGSGSPVVGTRIAYPGSLTEAIIAGGFPRDLAQMKQIGEPIAPYLARSCHHCSALVVPLISERQALGALVLLRGPESQSFPPEEVAQARVLGDLASLSLRRVLVMEERAGALSDASGARKTAEVAQDAAEDAQQRAEIAQREAEDANRAKSEFLASMSHELRTPINAIIGYAELLETEISGPVTDGQKEQLRRLRASSRHLLSLVNEILDLSKIESGRMEVAHARVLAVNTIAAALALVAPEAAHKGIHIEDLCSAADASYVGDEDRARQVLANLLSNAVKFTNAGGSVSISCGNNTEPDPGGVRESGVYTWFRVTDTGIGIPSAQLERIFQPFVQVETGHTRNHTGTGLGLSIARQLARLMGGDVTVQSHLGHGSMFTLWLPGDVVVQPPLAQSILQDARGKLPPGLKEIGEALRSSLDVILDRYDDRLRAEPLLPHAKNLRQGDLENHASSYIVDVAQSLVSIEQRESDLVELLRDGSEIQQLISRLHGGQRARLGWTEEALRREFVILREEIEAAVHRAQLPTVDAEEGIEVLRRFLEHAERISVREWRRRAVTTDLVHP